MRRTPLVFNSAICLALRLSGCLLFAWAVMASCTTQPNLEKMSDAQLAQHICGKCHLYPEPELLPAESWSKILPQQRHFLGLRYPGENPYQGAIGQEPLFLGAMNVYPETPEVTDSTWMRIERFYLSRGRDQKSEPRSYAETDLFRAEFPETTLGGFPAVSMVEYDQEEQRLFVGDINGLVSELDHDFRTTNFTKLTSPIVKVLPDHEQGIVYMLDAGILDPRDLPKGALVGTDLRTFSQRMLYFEELLRPVDFAQIDWNGDADLDWIVCEFGNLTGRLSVHQASEQKFESLTLKHEPGAIQVEVLDWEGDGDSDFMVLFAHGDERLVLFENYGEGRYRDTDLIRFQPLLGSMAFVIRDLDGDDDFDLIHVAGDNTSTHDVLKQDQGVRVFENQGNFQFSERAFLPMFGAYDVEVADFDKDGNLDFVANAFYPDFENGLDQAILFMRGAGAYQYEIFQVPGADRGRWMVMDSGDFDQDGDRDLVLGAFMLGPGVIPREIARTWIDDDHHLMILRNSAR